MIDAVRSLKSTFGRLRRRPLPVPSMLGLLALVVATTGAAAPGMRLAAAAATIYVSPAGLDGSPGTQASPTTLTHAQALVRSQNQSMSGDIDVVLLEGVYRLSQPLTFGPADSGIGGHNVVCAATPGVHPVISGADRITGWTRVGGTSTWVAQAPTGLQTRQLYVNGTRAARAHGSLPVTVHQTATG